MAAPRPVRLDGPPQQAVVALAPAGGEDGNMAASARRESRVVAALSK